MDLDLAKFEPTTAALTEMAESFKCLIIKGVDDKVGLKAVHDARITLRNARGAITRRGKEMREDALMFQKKVIKKESELIALIQPVEQDLAAKEDAIEAEKEKIKRADKLPMRRASVEAYGGTFTDDELLGMDETQFQAMMNNAKEKFLAEKEATLRDEASRLEAEKQVIEDKKNTEARAAQRAQEEKDHAAEIERIKAETEIKARAAVEAELAAKAEKQKTDEAAAQKLAEAEQKKIEKRVQYKKWLDACGYTEENKADFTIVRNENVITLYRMVSTFTIE